LNQTLEEATAEGPSIKNKLLVPVLVSTVWAKNKSELDDRSCTGFLTIQSNGYKYDGLLIVHILKIIQYRAGSQCRDFISDIECVKRDDLVTKFDTQF